MRVFPLKKINAFKSVNLFIPEFIEAANLAAEYFANSTGSVLGEKYRKYFLINSDKFKIKDEETGNPKKHAGKICHTINRRRQIRPL